jgi:hypothetical protein
MTSVSLYVELKAKSGKEEEVAAFLAGAQSLVDPNRALKIFSQPEAIR